MSEENMASIQKELDDIIIKMVVNADSVKGVIENLKERRKAVKSFGNFSLKKPSAKNIWIDQDSLIKGMYASYDTAFSTYEKFKDSLKNKSWRAIKKRKERRKQRQALIDEIDSLKADVKAKHSLVLSRIELDLEIEQQLLDPMKTMAGEVKKGLQADKKRHEDWLQASNRALKKLRKDKQIVEERLDEANMELKFALDSGEDIEPEVLVVAPAEIAVYINMKEVLIEEAEDSTEIVRIYVPPIAFDRALIELPDKEGVYDMDGKKTELSNSQQGAYFDLFDQLKVTILEKHIEVKDKAIANGIIQEGEKMARVYLENFMRPLGIAYEIIQLPQGTEMESFSR